MKVLYIGHYKENTGWGKAARDYILALDAAGVEVVPRPVKLNGNMPEIPQRILELESKSSRGATHCIQHVLPHHLDYNGRFEKNIVIGVYECFDADMSSWPSKINLMDELWTPSSFTEQVFISMGIDIPITIVPHTFDLSVYDKPREKIQHPHLEGNYVFYTIADSNKRKDLLSLVQAFNLEFTANEPVRLLIKTTKFGATTTEVAEGMIRDCNAVKASMKLMRNPEDYQQEIVLPDHLSDEDIYRLHLTCDCFVTTTHGEAWSIPLFDALAMGKSAIYPRDMFDYVPKYSGYDNADVPVFGMTDTFSDISTSREMWMQGDIRDIGAMMRESYQGKRNIPKQDMSKYSYANVGALMKKELERTE